MLDHMAKPDEKGRHPEFPHLVMAEIEPHHGMWILTFPGHDGDALISEDDAVEIFGDQLDAEFGYILDDYLSLIQ